jgi:hypothetical protein
MAHGIPVGPVGRFDKQMGFAAAGASMTFSGM